MNTCETCRFWLPEARPTFGQCRRRAPITVPGHMARVWPDTPCDAWCGEHEDKEAFAERAAIFDRRLAQRLGVGDAPPA